MRDIASSGILNGVQPAFNFSFTVLFTAMGMQHYVGQPREIITFLIGIASGSFLFWYAVSMAVTHLRRTDREHWVQSANKYTGVALGIIGAILVTISIIKSIF